MSKTATDKKGTSSKLDEYKKGIMRRGEELIEKTFPERVFEIDALLNSDDFASNRDISQPVRIVQPSQSNGDTGNEVMSPKSKIPRLEHPTGDAPATSVPSTLPGFPIGHVEHSNQEIARLMKIIKGLQVTLLEEVQTVRLWVQLSIPKIEDGNNFGVQVQEEVLSEASQIEREAIEYMELYCRYCFFRAKGVTKAGKMPQVEDYSTYVNEMDCKEFNRMRITLMEMRNHYVTLQDLIMKNKDRIKKPRSNNSAGMF